MDRFSKILREELEKYEDVKHREYFESEGIKERDFVSVKGGEYPTYLRHKKRNVKVGDLFVSRYAVTQERYEEVMGKNPSNFKGKNRPVEMVTWEDCLHYCNELSKKNNLVPVYVFDGEELSKIRYIDGTEVDLSEADFSKTEGYRLPLEIEWEWFACGGYPAIEKGNFDATYSGSNEINNVAWIWDNGEKETHEVGTKSPNDLGLFDCSGNVYEWCYDMFVGSPDVSLEKPYIYGSKGKHVLKGGSFYNAASNCDLSYREGNFIPTYYYGFRVVRSM